MGMRPVAARWFEALSRRDDLSRLAEALARSGVVQIETQAETKHPEETRELGSELGEYETLARRYQPYWPSLEGAGRFPGSPSEVTLRALSAVRAWSHDADPTIVRIQQIQHESADLALIEELLEASGDDFPVLEDVKSAGPTLAARLYLLPRDKARRLELPPMHFVRRVESGPSVFVLVVGNASARARVDTALFAQKARALELPKWLSGGPSAAKQALSARLAELESEARASALELERIHGEHELRTALAELQRLAWFSSAVPKLPETRHFGVVTGWTSDTSGETLRTAIEDSGLYALIHFPPPPDDREPPVVLKNPKWVRPFETFALLLGTPGRNESDPSAVLVVIAPLLFGFMFGDVGQGLCLIALGLLLKKRMPVMRLLIAGGIMAVVFGLAFGCVFAREDLIRPLVFHPLSRPLAVLAISLAAGAVTLLVGLGLGGIQASWRGQFGRWLHEDGALILIYLGLLGLFLSSLSVVLVIGGVLLHLVGAALEARSRRAATLAEAMGHLVERSLQLLVNTISFARVGAFALAHAGLCAAIAALALAVKSPIAALVILILGNAFTITLEGLTVSIQTTRLVLFEFFVRFLRGEGRAFRPLLPPHLSEGVRP